MSGVGSSSANGTPPGSPRRRADQQQSPRHATNVRPDQTTVTPRNTDKSAAGSPSQAIRALRDVQALQDAQARTALGVVSERSDDAPQENAGNTSAHATPDRSPDNSSVSGSDSNPSSTGTTPSFPDTGTQRMQAVDEDDESYGSWSDAADDSEGNVDPMSQTMGRPTNTVADASSANGNLAYSGSIDGNDDGGQVEQSDFARMMASLSIDETSSEEEEDDEGFVINSDLVGRLESYGVQTTEEALREHQAAGTLLNFLDPDKSIRDVLDEDQREDATVILNSLQEDVEDYGTSPADVTSKRAGFGTDYTGAACEARATARREENRAADEIRESDELNAQRRFQSPTDALKKEFPQYATLISGLGMKYAMEGKQDYEADIRAHVERLVQKQSQDTDKLKREFGSFSELIDNLSAEGMPASDIETLLRTNEGTIQEGAAITPKTPGELENRLKPPVS